MTDAPHLVVVDPQNVFADPGSPWGSPMWPTALGAIRDLCAEHAGRVVTTRFVAPAEPTGAWVPYYRAWPFALVPQDDPLYDVVPDLADVEATVVTATTFGKWGPDLAAVVGAQPHLVVAGVSTDCCVLSTVLAAADAGATVRVVARACAGSTEEDHERALALMELYAPLVTVDRG